MNLVKNKKVLGWKKNMLMCNLQPLITLNTTYSFIFAFSVSNNLTIFGGLFSGFFFSFVVFSSKPLQIEIFLQKLLRRTKQLQCL